MRRASHFLVNVKCIQELMFGLLSHFIITEMQHTASLSKKGNLPAYIIGNFRDGAGFRYD